MLIQDNCKISNYKAIIHIKNLLFLNLMKKPSYISEASAIVMVSYLLFESLNYLPDHLILIPVITGIFFIIDWMMYGVVDKGICKDCF